MSEPDNPRWLDDVGAELRQQVPVRVAWRERLLQDIANEPRPSLATDAIDPRDTARVSHGRRIVLSPFAGIAAALIFAALGAGVAVATLSWGEREARLVVADSAVETGATSSFASHSASGAAVERETVRFELAAPRAAHVALVGSFNEWNPVATPLERDPTTGKWIVSLRLPPGRHVYAFVVDGDVTADPTAPRAADDDFGSAKSVLLVSGRSS